MCTNVVFRRVNWFMMIFCLLSLVFGSFVATQTSAKAQSATTQTITEFPLSNNNILPQAIIAGADGNVWFTDNTNIAKVSPSGSVTNFPISTNGFGMSLSLTLGADGNIWFAGYHNYDINIGRITSDGTITEFPLPNTISVEYSLVQGSDGNLWFTDQANNSIGRFSPSGTVTEFPVPTANSELTSMTKGPNGNLWFIESNSRKVGEITATGTITEFPLTSSAYPAGGITLGADGNLWFLENSTSRGVYYIAKMTTNGIETQYVIPTFNSLPKGITLGKDGNIWFTEEYGNNIGRITSDGTITEFPVLTSTSYPLGITSGPDGNIWFTENQTNKIGRVNLASISTPPTVNNASFNGTEGQTGSGTVQAQSASGSSLTVTATRLPSFASFTDNGNGTGTVTYTPKAGNAGTYTFSVTANDGSQTGTGTVTLTIAKATPRKSLVVIVDGINSSLEATSKQAYARGGDGQDGSPGFFAKAGNIPGVIPFLQSNSTTYKNARIIMYSYTGSNSIGQPNAYSCRDTFVNPLVKDAQRLADQIKAALKGDPNQDITLLGHSQGGLVLLTYITGLVGVKGSSYTLPTGAHIKYVATFDSPDGGVSNQNGYTNLSGTFFRNASLGGCKDLKPNDKLVSLSDMQAVYKTATDKNSVGQTASILSALMGGLYTKNQDILAKAVAKYGMSFATFANVDDLLWLPNRCTHILQDFPSTAWVYDGGNNSHLYVRRFFAGALLCFGNLAFSSANHFQVLNPTGCATR